MIKNIDHECMTIILNIHLLHAGSNITEEEVRVAEDKFEESKNSAETAMHNLLEAEVRY